MTETLDTCYPDIARSQCLDSRRKVINVPLTNWRLKTCVDSNLSHIENLSAW